MPTNNPNGAMPTSAPKLRDTKIVEDFLAQLAASKQGAADASRGRSGDAFRQGDQFVNNGDSSVSGVVDESEGNSYDFSTLQGLFDYLPGYKDDYIGNAMSKAELFMSLWQYLQNRQWATDDANTAWQRQLFLNDLDWSRNNQVATFQRLLSLGMSPSAAMAALGGAGSSSGSSASAPMPASSGFSPIPSADNNVSAQRASLISGTMVNGVAALNGLAQTADTLVNMGINTAMAKPRMETIKAMQSEEFDAMYEAFFDSIDKGGVQYTTEEYQSPTLMRKRWREGAANPEGADYAALSDVWNAYERGMKKYGKWWSTAMDETYAGLIGARFGKPMDAWHAASVENDLTRGRIQNAIGQQQYYHAIFDNSAIIGGMKSRFMACLASAQDNSFANAMSSAGLMMDENARIYFYGKDGAEVDLFGNTPESNEVLSMLFPDAASEYDYSGLAAALQYSQEIFGRNVPQAQAKMEAMTYQSRYLLDLLQSRVTQGGIDYITSPQGRAANELYQGLRIAGYYDSLYADVAQQNADANTTNARTNQGMLINDTQRVGLQAGQLGETIRHNQRQEDILLDSNRIKEVLGNGYLQLGKDRLKFDKLRYYTTDLPLQWTHQVNEGLNTFLNFIPFLGGSKVGVNPSTMKSAFSRSSGSSYNVNDLFDY